MFDVVDVRCNTCKSTLKVELNFQYIEQTTDKEIVLTHHGIQILQRLHVGFQIGNLIRNEQQHEQTNGRNVNKYMKLHFKLLRRSFLTFQIAV